VGSDDGTAEAIRLAYNRSAAAWMSGPDTLYGRLAEALLTAAPLPMAGARVLDLGAGTGVAGRAAIAAGARQVVAVDIAEDMLRSGLGATAGVVLPVVADATHLPFTAQAFDIVCAAFCLGHLPDPVAALKEARRVGRSIVASAFAAGWTHPAKAAVDDALGEFGYSAPAWHVALKDHLEPQVGDPQRLALAATAAGYSRVDVSVVSVPSGLNTPAELVRWRLGMAHLAPFVQGLAPADLERATLAAEAALVGAPPPVVPMVVLAAS
jgi:SAM-dependent methyltransferase